MIITSKKRKKTIVFWSTVWIFLIATSFSILGWINDTVASDIKISVIYNNIPFDSRLENNWGFSCFIEGMEETILFDTGNPDSIMLNNMKIMGISPEVVHSVFLSHYHTDHIGGLDDFLRQKANVYVNKKFIPVRFRFCLIKLDIRFLTQDL